MDAHYCHKCNTPWENDKRSPGFKETCSGCGAYLHCCKNCRFHVPTAHNQCYIPDTEYVVNRAGLNFCEEFGIRDAAGESTRQKHARDAFAGLFGEEDHEGSASSFDDLFKE